MQKQVLICLAIMAGLVACSRQEDAPAASVQTAAVPARADIEVDAKTNALVKAIYERDMKMIADHLASGTNLNAFSEDRNTPLIAAIHADIPEVVKKLLEQGASPDLSAPDRAPPLFVVVEKDKPEYASWLISRKANPSIVFDGVDIARFCVMNGRLGVLQELERVGADVKKLDSLGVSNVSIVLDKSVSVEVLDFLISKGVSGTARDLDRVIAMGEEPRGLTLLKNSQINPNADLSSEGSTAKIGNTLLSHAIAQNQMVIARELVARGANGTDAFAAHMKDENLPKIGFLLDKRVVNLAYQYPDVAGANPLAYQALQSGQYKVVEALLKAGLDVEIRGTTVEGSKHLYCLAEDRMRRFSRDNESILVGIATTVIQKSKEKSVKCENEHDAYFGFLQNMQDKKVMFKAIVPEFVKAGWMNLDKIRSPVNDTQVSFLCYLQPSSGHIPSADLIEYAEMALKLGASVSEAAKCARNDGDPYSGFLAKTIQNPRR